MTPNQKLKKLLQRKNGCTAVDVAAILPSLCAHKRISELKHEEGWTIKKKQDGKLKRYFGTPPCNK